MFKKLSLILVLLVLVVAIGTTVAQDSEFSGEITVEANRYYTPDQDPETSSITESVVEAYMEMQPNVTINLIPDLPAGTNRDTWLASRIAAGEAPDVAWDQFFNRNRVQGDWWVALDEFLEMPNPYIEEGIPGSERWIESFPDFVMNQTRAPDGHWYQVSLDWVETALYYNVDMFNEAGVEAEWDSWGEFIADMQTIQDDLGVEAVGAFMAGTGWSNWYWADSLWLTAVWHDMAPEFYMDKYNELQPGMDWRQLNAEEVAKAIYDGTLSTTDPRMETYLRISKEFTEILPIDYIGITSLEDVQRMFLGEQLAVFWGGTWNNKPITDAAEFEWGVTYLPPLTEEDFPGAPGRIYRVGGPSSAGQFGIPHSTVEAGNLELTIDYLMWFSAPQNFGPIANTFSGFIPMMAGAEIGPVLQNFQSVAGLQDRLFSDPSARLTLEHGDNWSQIMQGYFLDQTDEEATLELLQESWMSGALALCEQQGYDWCS